MNFWPRRDTQNGLAKRLNERWWGDGQTVMLNALHQRTEAAFDHSTEPFRYFSIFFSFLFFVLIRIAQCTMSIRLQVLSGQRSLMYSSLESEMVVAIVPHADELSNLNHARNTTFALMCNSFYFTSNANHNNNNYPVVLVESDGYHTHPHTCLLWCHRFGTVRYTFHFFSPAFVFRCQERRQRAKYPDQW